MNDDVREAFGELLVAAVHDRSIDSCDGLRNPALLGSAGRRWQTEVLPVTTDRALDIVIADVVDHVIFELVSAIDNEELKLDWTPRGAETTYNLADLGRQEMAGDWADPDDGWRTKHASRRSFPM